jgi:putative ABC transport system permease protein
LFRSAKVDAELENELQYHLEQLTRENIAQGMEAGAARLAARRELGGVAQIEEQCRDQRRVSWLTDIGKEVKYAWRMFSKSPGFTVLAIVTLAFGVGASLTVYTLAESLLLRSLPYASPERLAAIYSVHVRRGSLEAIGQEDFRDWQAANTVFERMAFTEFDQMTLTGHGDAERITGTAVSEAFSKCWVWRRWWAAGLHRRSRSRVRIACSCLVTGSGFADSVRGRTWWAARYS